MSETQLHTTLSWFEQLRFVSWHEDQLVIGVPTKAFYGEFDKKYMPRLMPFLRREFGDAVRVGYTWAKTGENVQDKPQAPQATDLEPHLIHGYTFKNFIKGSSNQTALSIAKAIADKPYQDTFNPFFLYGPSGVGKTHLVSAIGHQMREKHPEKRILFVPAHLFKTQFTDAMLNSKPNDFIHFYQSIDLLIIDDIQELTGQKTQQTFFHIFNHLQQNHRQIVITCDRPPVTIEGLEERMLSRFKWGLVTEMERPDVVLRRDILAAKVRRAGLRFPREVLDYIAENVESNVRDLEGIVNSIIAYSVADDCDINLELTRRVVARVVNISSQGMTFESISKKLCSHYGVKMSDLEGKGRKSNVVFARQLLMYLTHKYTKLSCTDIGKKLGQRDHTTILHGCTQIEKMMNCDKNLRVDIEKLEAELK